MPMREAAANRESIEELRRGLRDAFGGGLRLTVGTRALEDSDAGLGREPLQPHPVYSADLTEVAAGRTLASARQVGWRVFVSKEVGGGRTAEVHWDEAEAAYVFGGVTEGGFVGETLDAIEEMGRLDEVRQGDYVLRILRIPGLSVYAVWLRSDSGGEDLVMPLGPTFGSLESGAVTSACDFDRALREPAAAVLAFEASNAP